MKRIFKLSMTFFIILSFSSQNLNALTRSQLQYPFYNNIEEECSVNTSDGGVVSLQSVYILGDSITVDAQDELRTDLEQAEFSITKINADGGRAISTDTAAPGTSGLDAIKEDGNLDNRQDGANIIASADAVVVALGTNSGNEDLNIEIPKLINEIRKAKADVPIFLVNLFYKKPTTITVEQRNNTISDQASRNSNVKVIDAYSAGISLLDDKVHPDGEGSRKFSETIVNHLKQNKSFILSGGSGELGSGSLIGLGYPDFDDEASIGTNITNFIREKTPSSPFLTVPNIANIGQFIVDESKNRDINPLFIAGSGLIENRYGTVGDAASKNNFFGMTDSSAGGYRMFPDAKTGILEFMDAIKNNIYNNGAYGKYKDAKNMYEYFSVHQTGTIAYPGEEIDPNDLSGPVFDSNGNVILYKQDKNNSNKPDGNKMDGYDPRMGVYMSWTEKVHPNKEYPSTAIFNPLYYYRMNIEVVNSVTGSNFDPENPSGQLGLDACGNTSVPSTGDASKYITDCGANDGNAAIACTAINQLMGIPYDQAKRALATDPTPAFLDCSALTGMALYRTFGVDLGGICSTAYLTNPNFERIEDIRDIKPGDFIGKGTGCATGGGGGHIALVVSYNKETKELVTIESSSKRYPSGIRGGPDGTYPVSLAVDGLGGYYIWAVRYIGDKTLQPGAM